MNAQVTIEYLFLSLIALALLSFSVISLVSIRDASEKAFEATQFKSTAAEFANAMSEVCALGKGNAREAYAKREMDISGGNSSNTYYAVFTDTESNLEVARETFCGVENAAGVYGKTRISNDAGVIRFRKA